MVRHLAEDSQEVALVSCEGEYGNVKHHPKDALRTLVFASESKI